MDDTKNGDGRLTRRLVMFRTLAGVSAVAAGSAVATEAQAQRTDNDPSDAPGRGRGSGTDTDPTDAPGRGRVRGGTDRDPTDAPGRGRPRGVTDRDPSDAPGAGRR